MKQKSGFSGQIGFVLAAAGSAVGVGNLWSKGWRRTFPYYLSGTCFNSRFYIVNNRYCHWTKNRKKCHLCI